MGLLLVSTLPQVGWIILLDMRRLQITINIMDMNKHLIPSSRKFQAMKLDSIQSRNMCALTKAHIHIHQVSPKMLLMPVGTSLDTLSLWQVREQRKVNRAKTSGNSLDTSRERTKISKKLK